MEAREPVAVEPEEPFAPHERAEVDALLRALFEAYARPSDERAHKRALRRYLGAMTLVGRRVRMFEIANHRVFRGDGRLVVPFDLHGTLDVRAVTAEGVRRLALRRFPHGTVVTDALVAELAGEAGEPVDLEREIYDLDVERLPAVPTARVRDLVALLKRLNACGSRHEAVYLLRFLVARLCSASFQGFLGAKNLQPEVARLRRELAELLNGPFASRLRLPLRILVRSVSGLVSRPKLIDELWQDTIDLAEVRARGSAVSNELRRSAHHALGTRTLGLARAYRAWLETGGDEGLAAEDLRPGAADERVRDDPLARALVERIADTLEQLLGGAQVVARLDEWRAAYADELLRCPGGATAEEELEALCTLGLRAGNRWTVQLHARELLGLARAGGLAPGAGDALAERLDALSDGASGPGAPAPAAEPGLRAAAEELFARARAAHQDPLFDALDELVTPFERAEHLAAFERACALRARLDDVAARGAFHAQRYLLHQLDCLLEELSYLALRHLASGFDERGLDLAACLRVVHLCAANLRHDGLASREQLDLSAMLLAPGRTRRELLDLLEQIQRNYHRIVHRVSVAYEAMAPQLGYSPEEMRAVLAKFQRTMHDLNSIVQFADLARAHLSELEESPAGGDPTAGEGADPWDFVHLSHAADVAARVERADGPCLLDVYGGKGSGLVYIAHLGVPTRDGFVVPATLARRRLHERERPRLEAEVLRHVRLLEDDLARGPGPPARLGDPDAPLLLSTRGGSVFSMPGILSTVVFVGITDTIAERLAEADAWHAWDAYRRWLVSYAAAAWGLVLEDLDLVERTKTRHGVARKSELSGAAMRQVVEASKDAVRAAGHGDELDALLADPEQQLHAAVRAVHASWDREVARRYRRIKGLSDTWHTAVIVQQMASGNRSNEVVRPGMDEGRVSLTGVVPCTRMQATGFRSFTGDVKFSASGDDLVGGLTEIDSFQPLQTLRELAPMLERRLRHMDARLRRFRGTDPELEFTVERGVLSVLQARSAQAEVYVAPSDFVEPGEPAARGIGIRGGAFRGLVALTEADVESLRPLAAERADVDGVLLVLENPTPDEIPLILTADALLTARGGSTSHAAVAVHGVDEREYCAVLGAAGLGVDLAAGELRLPDGGASLRAGDLLAIHGQGGEVYLGAPAVRGA